MEEGSIPSTSGISPLKKRRQLNLGHLTLSEKQTVINLYKKFRVEEPALTTVKIVSQIALTLGHADTRQLGECSDTESADVRPKDNRRNLSPIKLTAFFKKNKDKVSTEELPESRHMETGEEIIQTEEQKPSEDPQEVKEGLVYAELDLVSQHLKPVVKNDDEKTEYAEIVYTPQDGNKGDKEQTTDKK